MEQQESVVAQYVKYRALRAELEDKASKIKEIEDKLKSEMLMSLAASGMDAFKQDGYTVSRKTTTRVEIADPAIFHEANFLSMQKARDEGRTASDGLLLQRTVSRTNVLATLRMHLGLPDKAELDPSNPAVQEQLDRLGLRIVQVADVSIRKSSN